MQGSILADRYLETMLADWKGTSLLLLQAPVLAGLAVMVWDNIGKATESMYFVMTLSAFWLGCMDGCREIVKERPLFLREKMANLNVGSYLYSKIYVLMLLNAVQVFVYSLVVSQFVDTRIPIGWLFIALFFSALCGSSLGLLISATVKKSDYAVAWVPIVIIPQILFSKFMIPEDQFRDLSEVAFKLMPSRWGYESLERFASTDGKVIEAFAHLMPLMTFSVIFLLIAYPILRAQKY